MTRRCDTCGRFKGIDSFAGEGGAGEGYMRAGFCMDAVDKVPNRKTDKGWRARINHYPHHCSGQQFFVTDAVEFLYEHGHEYAFRHASPTCTGYSRGTAAIPDRIGRYDRLIAATREALQTSPAPYVIENVEDAHPELRDPIMLCGRMFALSTYDTDGTHLVLDRHRLFESNVPLHQPPHLPHDPRLQVAGAYGGARRDKVEARTIRKGGYVPASLDVLRRLLDTPWMTEAGCFLSIPPAFTEYIGGQILDHIETDVAA